jgi:hypothetical protein
MIFYVNGPKLRWIETLFSQLNNGEKDLVRKLVKGGLKRKHKDYCKQLRDVGLDDLIKKKVTIPIDKARELGREKEIILQELIDKAEDSKSTE